MPPVAEAVRHAEAMSIARVRYIPALAQVPTRATYLEHHRTPDLSVGTYAIPANGEDPQDPHTEDEVYVVIAGRATLHTEQGEFPAGPGDILFVPAGVAHHFEAVEPDFRVVVVFGPAEGSRAG